MKKWAVIRVDGGATIGLGHLVRCLNFAKNLRKHNVDSLFVTKDLGNKAIELIRREKFKLKLIDKNVSFKKDASVTKEIAQSNNARFVLTDLGTEGNLLKKGEFLSFFKTLKSPGLFLVSIDDFKKIDFPFDIQIIPYCGAEDIEYKFSKNTTPLLGPKYYIAGLSDVRLVHRKKIIGKEATRILITIGGSDPTNLTLDIVKALVKLDTKGLNAKIVLGSCFPDTIKKSIKDILQKFKGTYEFSPGGNIVKLMLWADLVVSGIGLTRYEAALSGTPNLCVTRTRLNTYRIRKFVAAGTSKHFSVFRETSLCQIAKSIERLLENSTLRKKMHQCGKRLIDGKGADRIITELRKQKII